MHVQKGGCRDDSVHLRRLTVESGHHEHTHPHRSRILNFYPNLPRANIWVEDGKEVANPAFQYATGIRIQGNVRGIADLNREAKCVLIHVANYPD